MVISTAVHKTLAALEGALGEAAKVSRVLEIGAGTLEALGGERFAFGVASAEGEPPLVVRVSRGFRHSVNKVLRPAGPCKMAAFVAFFEQRIVVVQDYDADPGVVRSGLELWQNLRRAIYVPLALSPAPVLWCSLARCAVSLVPGEGGDR